MVFCGQIASTKTKIVISSNKLIKSLCNDIKPEWLSVALTSCSVGAHMVHGYIMIQSCIACRNTTARPCHGSFYNFLNPRYNS